VPSPVPGPVSQTSQEEKKEDSRVGPRSLAAEMGIYRVRQRDNATAAERSE
jgi:hypothetical protein